MISVKSLPATESFLVAVKKSALGEAVCKFSKGHELLKTVLRKQAKLHGRKRNLKKAIKGV